MNLELNLFDGIRAAAVDSQAMLATICITPTPGAWSAPPWSTGPQNSWSGSASYT